ncbi:GNAT family N-acetyltransferase [Caldicellulosiruptor morganii]|uniref:GNAT family N-acetyltransferase n=1 Tax=Caldicellulosiruptor morganii TaxID=1387555 RepID=A0ABY7BNV5_9FIRM|nr:GNAT family N-acetyltransferase [Caldicellulosiruptor morganii]WAM34480.1 GNAT family N-acetyltransferase [Caldicellulosiruptor morganii]
MVEIRQMNPDEKQTVKSLIEKCGFEYYDSAITHVVSDKDRIIGASQLAVEKSEAQILSIVVDENFRRMGFGDGLLKMQINHCYKNDISVVKVRKGIADGFFKRVGFIETQEWLVLDVQAFYLNLHCR